MDGVLKQMIVEEWRIHSTIFGSFMFACLPLLVAFFSAAATLGLPVFLEILPPQSLVLVVLYMFVFLGAMVGSFGLMGREFMNRRFGQASLIAYSSRTLPVSERRIFLDFVIKDVIYYLLLWVVPCVAGFAAAAGFVGIDPFTSGRLLLALSLSFLTGLSLVFFASTIYARSHRLFAGAALAVGIAAGTGGFARVDILGLLPPYLLFYDLSAGGLLAAVLLILVPAALSVAFVTVEYAETQRTFPNALDDIVRRVPVRPYAPFIAKDLLDLTRSEGGVGKIVFSFLVPVALIAVLLFAFLRFIPGLSLLLIFALFLAIVTSTVYNWLTEFDLFASYLFLPVQPGTLILAKSSEYAAFNIAPLAILGILGALIGQAGILLPATVAFVSLSAYTLAVTVYLTGLHPNIMLYSGKVFGLYVAAIAPLLLAMIFASLASPAILVGSMVLLPVAAVLFRAGIAKWNREEALRY